MNKAISNNGDRLKCKICLSKNTYALSDGAIKCRRCAGKTKDGEIIENPLGIGVKV